MTSSLTFCVLAVFTSFAGFLLLPKPSNGSLQSIFNHSAEINRILRLSQVRLPQITASSDVSYACKQAVRIVETSLELSFQYLDAFGKPQSAAILGNRKWLGSYSECTGIIPGAHYCLTFISASSLKKLFWGICVPQDCSEDDVTKGLRNAFTVLNTVLNATEFVLAPPPSHFGDSKPVVCAKPSEYTTGVILTLILCGLILFLVLVGTVIDLTTSFLKLRSESVNKTEGFMPVKDQSIAADIDRGISTDWNHQPYCTSDLAATNNPNVLVRFVMCFSLIQNTIRIMDTNVPPGAITSINGMRVLSMWWVILGHTYLQEADFSSNLFIAPQLVHRFTFQTVDNALFSVDSFFFLSGLLVSYLSLRQMEKNDGKLPLLKFYFHRFWRLTPTYMFVLLFYAKLSGFLGEGPLWYQMQSNARCDQYWWTNLLYINNFYPTAMGDECMGWTWYMANDMQFFIISPIVIYAAYRFRLAGLLVTIGSLLCASFVTTALIIHLYDLDVSFLGKLNANAKKDPQSLLYEKPYCRIAPYLVGMLLGYLLHTKRRKIPLVYLFNGIGWCVAIVLALSALYGQYKVLRKHKPKPFNQAENITYGTFSRFAWSLALAWVIYACHRGFGGLVNKILSARFWIPLSRLTYSAYLVHFIAIKVFFTSLETEWAIKDVQTSFCFVAMVAMSYAAAFIVAVCLEFPTMQLEKLIFKTNR